MECDLVAIETSLGCNLMEKLTNGENCSVCSSTLFSINNNLSELWNLDVLEITDPSENRSQVKKKQVIMLYFVSTVKRESDGRYEVCLGLMVIHLHQPIFKWLYNDWQMLLKNCTAMIIIKYIKKFLMGG